MKLPAYKAQSGDDYTRITLYPKKKVSEMTREERIAVCYQYACLLYEEGMAINNQIIRERFNLNKNQTVMASRILADALESGLINFIPVRQILGNGEIYFVFSDTCLCACT